MRVFVAIVFLFVGLQAAAQRRDPNFGWGAGAFNSNYRPAGSTPAAVTPNWRALEPSWRSGVLTYPGARRSAQASVAPYAYAPYGYGYGYGAYPPYGSSYYGFEPTQPDPEPQPAPPPVVVFQQPAPAPAPMPEPAPPPQVIVVQVPAPVAPPAPAPVVAAAPEPAQPKTPPREVYRWVDADGVTHYSTQVPAGVKADKVGPK